MGQCSSCLGAKQALHGSTAEGGLAPAQGLKALYPEKGGPGAVEVVPADLVRLQPGEFLNDTIIDFYMRCAPFLLRLLTGICCQLAVFACSILCLKRVCYALKNALSINLSAMRYVSFRGPSPDALHL